MNEGWSGRQRTAILFVSLVAATTAVGFSSDKSTAVALETGSGLRDPIPGGHAVTRNDCHLRRQHAS